MRIQAYIHIFIITITHIEHVEFIEYNPCVAFMRIL